MSTFECDIKGCDRGSIVELTLTSDHRPMRYSERCSIHIHTFNCCSISDCIYQGHKEHTDVCVQIAPFIGFIRDCETIVEIMPKMGG
jgi:hypothetical protein